MRSSLAALVCVPLAVIAAACADSGGTFDSGSGDGGLADSTFFDSPGFGDSEATGTLVVTPSNVAIDVIVGQTLPTVTPFTVTLDGTDVTAQSTWEPDRPDIGDVITSTATFQPTSTVGGLDTLKVKYQKATGSASATVTIHEKIVGVSPQQQAALDNPTGGVDPSAQVVYPYDETVFPLGMLGPAVQWNGASASDAYKLTIKEKYYDYVEYFANVAAPASHMLTDADWAAIGASGSGPKSDPVTFSLTRAAGTTAYDPITQKWHIAQANLHGIVYYWQIPGFDVVGCATGASNCQPGDIVRLKPGDKAPATFYTPPDSWTQSGTNAPAHCWGCHSVSRDGTTMAAAFNTNTNINTGTINLTNDTAGSVIPNEPLTGGVLPVFDNTGKYLLFSAEGWTSHGHFTGTTGGLDIMDSATGAIVKQGVMGPGCSEPAWSPDGTHVAATCNLGGSYCAGGWFFECSLGDIWVADASGSTITNPKQIIPAASARNGQADFSPDSNWLVYTRLPDGEYFAHGSIASNGGELYLTDLTGTQNIHLAAAAGAVPNRSANPRFAPLRAGGYSWVLFMSRRDYGNELIGQARPQLWITAIDDPPTSGDPSHPAFYLRGQDLTSKNMQAQFASPPCKAQGETCSTGADCCDHTSCVKQGSGYVCGATTGCSDLGNACTTSADCCDPNASCQDGYCTKIIY